MPKTAKNPAKKPVAHPPFRQTLFWDVDPKTIDPKRHARYIIERILDFGNDDEVRWLWRYYPHSLIYEVVTQSRGINPRTRILWETLTKPQASVGTPRS